ncbi:MAG TPA: hypothetical protein VFE33_19295 [Thermoanaerobaculia bacterium]|nr:hypothetical protein [Thermoanaerobaculia bacterium]
MSPASTLHRRSDGKLLELREDLVLGAGGEARIYRILGFKGPAPGKRALAAKIYHRPTREREAKLTVMLAHPPADPMAEMAEEDHVSLAWPVDLVERAGAAPPHPRVVGFLMPYLARMWPVFQIYNPGSRRHELPAFTYRHLLRTAQNLAAAVDVLHAHGYVAGDLNESNVLVADTALVTLVDTDSFQVRDPESGAVYRCPVGKPEFTPPELQGRAFGELDRTPEHDRFGLAVLLFLLLMEGNHPFAGAYKGRGEPPPLEERIAAGHFPYGVQSTPNLPARTAPPFDLLSPTLQAMFREAFEGGFGEPARRPSAALWRRALAQAQDTLVPCGGNLQHWYGSHLGACPWCERTAAMGGHDPFPSPEELRQRQQEEEASRKESRRVQKEEKRAAARPGAVKPGMRVPRGISIRSLPLVRFVRRWAFPLLLLPPAVLLLIAYLQIFSCRARASGDSSRIESSRRREVPWPTSPRGGFCRQFRHGVRRFTEF